MTNRGFCYTNRGFCYTKLGVACTAVSFGLTLPFCRLRGPGLRLRWLRTIVFLSNSIDIWAECKHSAASFAAG